MNIRCVVLSAFLISATTAVAEEGPKFWSTDVELGAGFTSGNTDQESVNLRIDSKRETELWINSFHVSALQDGDDTADRLYLFYRLDYRFDDDRGLFGRIAYEVDAFSGFENQLDVTMGYNQTLIR